jgi:hypothetical protein
MNKHSIVNLKCPCFLFRYPKVDIPSQALFNLHRASALPLRCGREDNQNFQSTSRHSRRSVRQRRYCMVLVCHNVVALCCNGTVLYWYCAVMVLYCSHGAVRGSGQGLFPPRRFLRLHQPPGDDLTWPLSPTITSWSGESAAAAAAGTSWPRLAPRSSERSWRPLTLDGAGWNVHCLISYVN